MFAYIPARINSKRIPKKNIRLLDGKPIIQHVIESISKVKDLQGIAVSTDSDEIANIVKTLPMVTTLELRDPKLSADSVPFRDLILHDIPRYKTFFNSNDILFSTATCALISTDIFQKGIDIYQSTQAKGLVISVSPFEPSAYLTITEETNGVKIWFPEQYLLPTKDLKPTYYDNGGFFIFNYLQFKNEQPLNILTDLKPLHILPISREVGIDLDNESDWERLEYFYKKLKINPIKNI